MYAISSKRDYELMNFHNDLSWNDIQRNRYPYFGKVSVTTVLETLYRTPGASYTQDELLKLVAGATWDTIVMAISRMKTKKYKYTRKPLVIRREEGSYVRQNG
jgi:hypothetical protein